MWLAALTQIMALAVTVPTAAAPSAPATATPSGVVYTRQMLFAIPFHIDRPESILQEPVEVRLYVSADQGGHWDYYAKAEPSRQQFMFRVDRDGQYWFQARTLDRSGTLRPKTLAPGLKVIVDTTPPKVQLQARPGDGGQVTVHWQIDELNLKPDSLTIQFRTAATAPWQPVAIDRQNLTATGSSQIGEVTFVPPRDVRNLENPRGRQRHGGQSGRDANPLAFEHRAAGVGRGGNSHRAAIRRDVGQERAPRSSASSQYQRPGSRHDAGRRSAGRGQCLAGRS